MAIKEKRRLKLFIYIASFFAFFVMTAPTYAYAATLTKTTVTVKLNRTSSKLSKYTDNDIKSFFTLQVSKVEDDEFYQYWDKKATISGSYIVLTAQINRCDKIKKLSQEGWKIEVRETEGNYTNYYKEIANKVSLCGNPVYAVSKTNGISKSGGGACDKCPAIEMFQNINMYAFVHKDIYTSETSVALEHPCTAGTKIGEAACPSNGNPFRFTLSKVKEPTSDYPYYVFKKEISQGDNAELPIVGWVARALSIRDPQTSETLNLSNAIAKIEDGKNNYITFKSDGTSKEEKPADTPKSVTNDDVPDSGGGGGETDTPKESTPVSIVIPGVGPIPILGNTDDCPTGASTYARGLLEGIPCNKPITSLAQVEKIVINVMKKILIPAVGTLFTIMIIAGGMMYISSAGNEKRIEKAKQILTFAIIGLLVSMLSYAIITIFVEIIGGGVNV